VSKEKELSEKDDKGCYLFCVSIDAGWNNHGSGKSYNSDSGHHITIGNHSGLVVALYHISKRCSKCEAGEKMGKVVACDASVCARNYHGSSKGMQSCKHLHQNHNIDVLTENSLKWIFVDALEAGLIGQIPTTPAGNKKVDN
jgi:hypothetical protein